MKSRKTSKRKQRAKKTKHQRKTKRKNIKGGSETIKPSSLPLLGRAKSSSIFPIGGTKPSPLPPLVVAQVGSFEPGRFEKIQMQIKIDQRKAEIEKKLRQEKK